MSNSTGIKVHFNFPASAAPFMTKWISQKWLCQTLARSKIFSSHAWRKQHQTSEVCFIDSGIFFLMNIHEPVG